MEQIIKKMCIAEIQRTFGISRISATRLKNNYPVNVDYQKVINFLKEQKLMV